MLDTTTYRQQESLARQSLAAWQLAQRHNLDQFESDGFPVRLGCLSETYMLLDTMHEGRLTTVQEELGGLGPADLERLVAAAADVVRFQLAGFPHRPLRMPLDTLASMLLAYRKISDAKPGFGSLLEVGPGCGYLACLLKGHAQLANYCHTDACESFYLLQHHLNLFLFAEDFRQELFAGVPTSATHSVLEKRMEGAAQTFALDMKPKVRQYPWWRLGDLARQGKAFDVIVANANLVEFHREALADYLALFKRVLAPGGVVFAQCIGFEVPARDRHYLFDMLFRAGFAPLGIAFGGQPKARGAWDGFMEGDCPFISEDDKRLFCLDNLLLVAEGHPHFAAAYGRHNYRLKCIRDTQEAAALFAPPAKDARFYTRGELVELITARLTREPKD